jgi:hypothetical protein
MRLFAATRSRIDVDAVRNQSAPRILAFPLVVVFAGVTQVKMQCAPLAAQQRAERTGVLVAPGLGEPPTLLAPGEPAALGDGDDIRATSETASRDDPFAEDFSNEVMFEPYLYCKLPETGVSAHIGTGGKHPAARDLHREP